MKKKGTYVKPTIKLVGDFTKVTLGPHVSGIPDGTTAGDGAYRPTIRG